MQARASDLGAVVKSWKSEFPGLQYVYAWHALHAYWNGVSPTDSGTKKYGAEIQHPRPTPGTLEVDPSMAWSAAVMNGVGVVADPVPLHNDMHSYLQGDHRVLGRQSIEIGAESQVFRVHATILENPPPPPPPPQHA